MSGFRLGTLFPDDVSRKLLALAQAKGTTPYQLLIDVITTLFEVQKKEQEKSRE